jgi:transcriptional regulator of nitric oxide reductase
METVSKPCTSCEFYNFLPKSYNGTQRETAYLWVDKQKTNIMSLLNVLIVLVVVGVVLWLINNYIPMDRKIKSILNVVAIIAVIIWLLQVFGVLDSFKNLNI